MRLSHFGILLFVFLFGNSPVFAIEGEQTDVEPIVKSVISEQPTEALPGLGKIAQKVEEKAGLLSLRARKEVDKYRVRLTIDPLGNIFDSDDADTDGGIYYQLVVEPAFRNQEQLRRDIWVVDLGAGSNFRIGGSIRLTFSRYFNGPDAKLNALTAFPYCPVNLIICKRKTPLNSNELKTNFKDKEGFRLEVTGDIAAGLSQDLTKGNAFGGAFVRYKRAGQFIMDLYKENQLHSRARFIGIKNTGEVEMGVSFKNPISSLFSGALSFIKRKINLGFWMKGRHSFNFFQERQPKTLDTMMADYQFNFSSPEVLTNEQLQNPEIAEHALDEVLLNVRRGGFSSLFLFFYKGDEVARKLLAKAESAEKLFSADMRRYRAREIKLDQIRVVNHFKGKMKSFIKSFDFGGSAFDWAGGQGLTGSQSNFVISYDLDQVPRYYRFENSFIRNKARFFWGRNKLVFNNDVDILMHSDVNESVGELSDVVVKTEIEETTLDDNELAMLKRIILNILPPQFQSDEKLLAAIGSGTKTNANYTYRSSFGAEALEFAKARNKPEIHQKLIEYFESHPERQFMHLPIDQSSGDASTRSLSEYTEEKAVHIARIINPNFDRKVPLTDEHEIRKARLEAMSLALQDPVFEKYLMAEFFPRLLPDSPFPKKAYAFNLKSSSFESGTQEAKVGGNSISAVYEAVAFIRNIINDRSLDLQMTNSILNAPQVAPAEVKK